MLHSCQLLLIVFLIVFAFDPVLTANMAPPASGISFGHQRLFSAQILVRRLMFELSACIISSIWYLIIQCGLLKCFLHRHSNFWPGVDLLNRRMEFAKMIIWAKIMELTWEKFKCVSSERSRLRGRYLDGAGEENSVQTSGNSADLNFYFRKSTPYWWIDTGEHRRCIG